jgi:hypothetical protein
VKGSAERRNASGAAPYGVRAGAETASLANTRGELKDAGLDARSLLVRLCWRLEACAVDLRLELALLEQVLRAFRFRAPMQATVGLGSPFFFDLGLTLSELVEID